MAGVSGALALGGAVAGAVSGSSGGGGGGGIPKWARKARKANYGSAQDAAAGMSVAGFTPDQLGAMEGVRDFQGYLDSDMSDAQAEAKRLSGGIGEQDIAQFYNPFENDVVGAFLGDLQAMRKQNGLVANDLAERSNAFGGDRDAVYRAVSNGELDRTAASSIAGLRSSGFNTAVSGALSNRGLQLAGNAQLSSLIESRRAARLQELQALMASGALQQDRAQRVANLPADRVKFLSDYLNGVPYNAPSTPYDPVAGAITGFQGGYGMGTDLAGLISRMKSGWGSPSAVPMADPGPIKVDAPPITFGLGRI